MSVIKLNDCVGNNLGERTLDFIHQSLMEDPDFKLEAGVTGPYRYRVLFTNREGPECMLWCKDAREAKRKSTIDYKRARIEELKLEISELERLEAQNPEQIQR